MRLLLDILFIDEKNVPQAEEVRIQGSPFDRKGFCIKRKEKSKSIPFPCLKNGRGFLFC